MQFNFLKKQITQYFLSQTYIIHQLLTKANTVFTLEPTITDLKLVRICFKASSNNYLLFIYYLLLFIYYLLFTIYYLQHLSVSNILHQVAKRNNDCFQFLAVYIVYDNARCTLIYDMLKTLQGCLKSLEYYIFNCLHYKIINHSKLKTKTVENHYGNFCVFLLILFRSKSVLISKIQCKRNP